MQLFFHECSGIVQQCIDVNVWKNLYEGVTTARFTVCNVSNTHLLPLKTLHVLDLITLMRHFCD